MLVSRRVLLWKLLVSIGASDHLSMRSFNGELAVCSHHSCYMAAGPGPVMSCNLCDDFRCDIFFGGRGGGIAALSELPPDRLQSFGI